MSHLNMFIFKVDVFHVGFSVLYTYVFQSDLELIKPTTHETSWTTRCVSLLKRCKYICWDEHMANFVCNFVELLLNDADYNTIKTFDVELI